MNNYKLHQSLMSAIKHNRDGSHSTQAQRAENLSKLGRELKECGFRNIDPQKLGQRHVNKLVEKWKGAGNSDATLKNKLSHVRWAYEKLGRGSTLAKTNKELGVNDRIKTSNTDNKAKEIDTVKAQKLSPREQSSLRLQRAFGLRREESLKIQPSKADKGTHVALKPSWCKGGRYREIPITSAEQRAALDEAKTLAGKDSMIPPDKTYFEHMKSMSNKMEYIGLKNQHGYRHAYAQQRYKEITGNTCPKAGGKLAHELSDEEKRLDHEARMTISKELGHNRKDVTNAYLGSTHLTK